MEDIQHGGFGEMEDVRHILQVLVGSLSEKFEALSIEVTKISII